MYSGRGSLPRSLQPRIGDRQRLGRRALDDRDELDEVGLQLVAEEAIDLDRMIGVRGVDRAQDVDVDAVPVQALPAAHHVVERALAAFVDAVGVVHLARAVDAQADEDLVLLEERAPLVVEPRAVGLDRVGDLLSGPLILPHVLDRALEEVEAHQRRLAALPADDDLGSGLRLDAAGGCTSRAARRPSGTGCPGTASPSRGRSSTCSRGCRSPRSAWPADETASGRARVSSALR